MTKSDSVLTRNIPLHRASAKHHQWPRFPQLLKSPPALPRSPLPAPHSSESPSAQATLLSPHSTRLPTVCQQQHQSPCRLALVLSYYALILPQLHTTFPLASPVPPLSLLWGQTFSISNASLPTLIQLVFSTYNLEALSPAAQPLCRIRRGFPTFFPLPCNHLNHQHHFNTSTKVHKLVTRRW